MNIDKLLTELNACNEAKEWAYGKTWEEIHATCHRGDWLLWLFKKTNPDDRKNLTLAKAYCANTVRHLMKDKRSTDAIDAAIKFGNGEITESELKTAADAAYSADAAAAAAAAAYAADAYAADAAYSADAAAAAAAAAYAADAYAADAAYSADAAAAAYSADAAYRIAARKKAREENQMLTANICRQYLPIEIWNVKND